MSNTRKNEIFEAHSQRELSHSPGALIFEVPTIEVPLPSNGKVYPEGHPLCGKESLTISTMTAAQENILTNKSLAKKGTLLTHLIQSCIKDPSVKARDMLIGDRNTVLISLRLSGYGANYKVGVACPECSEQCTHEFDLSQLPVRRLEIDPIEQGLNLFEFVLPMSKARVKFKFLTGADEEEIAMTQAQKKKTLGVDNDMVTSGLLQTIVSINGISDRSQISVALPKMPAFDSQALRKFIQDNEPGMQLVGAFECPSCSYEGEVDVPLGASFFWPGAK
jgi:hypothetical protein